ncbi:MAG: efflux RND transporter periplasmic adaptor subunit [Phycisphaerales bacterium]
MSDEISGAKAAAMFAAVPGRLVGLAASTPSPSHYLRDLLRLLCEATDAPFGRLVVRRGAQVIEESWHRSGGDPAFWSGAIERIVDEALSSGAPRARVYAARGGAETVAIVGHPITGPAGTGDGAIGLVIPNPPAGQVAAVTAELGRVLSHAMVLSGNGGGGRAADATPGGEELEAMRVAGPVQGRRHLAFRLANGLRSRVGAEMVSVGLVRGRRVRVLAISGFDDVASRSPGVRVIRAAMEEALDAGESLVARSVDQWDDGTTDAIPRLHQAWHLDAGRASVMSTPLVDDSDRPVAVVAIRAKPGAALGPDEVARIERTLAPYGMLIPLAHRAERGMLAHASEAARDWVAAFAGPGTLVRRLLVVAILVAVATWLVLGRQSFEVAGTATLQPMTMRQVTVPFDGTLASIDVRRGDRVVAGAVLGRIETTDLELEASRLRATIAGHESDARRHTATGDTLAAALARSDAAARHAELEAIARRIERAVIRAPFDGTVVSADDDRRLGRHAARGEPMFAVAADDGWKLDIQVNETDAGWIDRGFRGRFAARARPDGREEVMVQRVAPAAEAFGGRNTVHVEARVPVAEDWMRPGLAGVARLDVGERPNWWVLGRRPVAWLRGIFWR